MEPEMAKVYLPILIKISIQDTGKMERNMAKEPMFFMTPKAEYLLYLVYRRIL
jgi:hypothetical protein